MSTLSSNQNKSFSEPKLCIDLCAGLGGFSQAFKDDPTWEVITVEFDKKFKPTILADVCHLPLKRNLAPVVLLASPPCNHFSLACFQFPRVGIKNALKVVGACFEAVAWLKPNKWLIENPRGRLRHIIGKPPQTIRYSDYDKDIKMMKTTDLWGNCFLPMVNHVRKIKLSSGIKDPGERLRHNFPQDGSFKGQERKDLPAIRAKVPFGVSLAVKQGVEQNEN